ncbi:MAG: SWIM zinc finger family protein [Chlamydiae bacterium]|nr:SWIM zinc finger family protein [Chlamydiota bacterium]
MGYYSRWPEYVSVAEKKRKAEKHLKSLGKKGKKLNPITIKGRNIANTFWGKAWCENLESYSDYENRLPRGRSYVRNGSVLDLQITQGKIKAQVMGSYLYEIEIEIKPMTDAKWKALVKLCSGKIDSMIELLQGKFSQGVMSIITEKEGGLFPKPGEIEMDCSCPDSAGMCKHLAAVLYGVGATLDNNPEALFTLRHVNHIDLITAVGSKETLIQKGAGETVLKDSELSNIFGIDIDEGKVAKPAPKKAKSPKKVKTKTSKSKIKSTKKSSKKVSAKKKN